MADMLGKPLTPAMAAAIIGPWAGAYVGMSGQLDKANGRTADTISIVGVCESQANAARVK